MNIDLEMRIWSDTVAFSPTVQDAIRKGGLYDLVMPDHMHEGLVYG